MKIKIRVIALLGILFPLAGISQGILNGTIRDTKNTPIQNATIELVEKKIKAKSDSNGNYELKAEPGQYTVNFTAPEFKSKTVYNVELSSSAPTTLNAELASKKVKIDDINVKGTTKKENITTLISKQRNSLTITEAIGAEAIKLIPARTTSDVLKKVSGTTIVDNKFVVIRGLSDRYNCVFINGSSLPSTDPDRKTFSFDLIPSNVIENMQINKAATADIPGDFAGGVIYIQTRDAGKKNEVTVNTSIGFNNQATFANSYQSNKFNGDLFGMNTTDRSMPSSVQNLTTSLNSLPLNDAYAVTRSFLDNFTGNRMNVIAPNGAINVTGNKNIKLKDKSYINILGLVNYNRNFRREFTQRIDRDIDGAISFDFLDTATRENLLTSGMLNVSYQINEGQRINFKNIINQNTEFLDMNRVGEIPTADNRIKSYVNSYINNILSSSALSGKHKIYKKIQLEWLTSYNNINRNQPDLRNVLYTRSLSDPEDSIYRVAMNSTPNMQTAGRFFSKLNENILNNSFELTIPVKKDLYTIKTGYYMLNRNRAFDARRFGYIVNNQLSKLLTLSPEELFISKNVGVDGFRIGEHTQPADNYTASSRNNAPYLLNELTLKWVKLNFGLRYELFDLDLKSNDGLQVREYTRNFKNLLPSIVSTFVIDDKTNVRASYGRTLSRPEFREIAPFAFFDFVTNSVVQGYDSLTQATIDNMDVKYEWYPSKGEVISIGGFYKYFDKPIEQSFYSTGAGAQTRSFLNSDFATLYGAEIDFRKKLQFLTEREKSLLNNMAVYGNLALMKSNVEYTFLNLKQSRALQGQSNSIINVGVSYTHPENLWTSALSYNRIGQRIALVGDNTEPAVWEKPRNLLDFTISRMINKKFEGRFTASDILNNPFVFYQNDDNSSQFNRTKSQIFTRTLQGSAYSLNLIYRL